MTRSIIPLTFLITFFLSLLPSALCHGYVRQIAIDGKLYRGNIPQTTNFPSPIRAIDDASPVKGATNISVNCGHNAQPAALVAPANPGSKLTFDWAGDDNGPWPHNIGPMLTYLALCENTSCDKFDATTAKWFKIDQAGRKNDQDWFQLDIFNGNTYSTHLPTNLAPGDYLVRHEIIALHLADQPGGAEFYPSCSQIRVGGNGTGVPTSTVSLPGAYSDNDPGIFDPTVFDGTPYQFPGPTIDPDLASNSVAITGPAPSTDGQPDPTVSANFILSTPSSSGYYAHARRIVLRSESGSAGPSSSAASGSSRLMRRRVLLPHSA